MDVPTELMRSWVGQDVAVLAYSAGAPVSPATGTPGGVPGTPEAPTPGGTPGSPAAPTPEEVSAGYSVTLDRFAGRLDDVSALGVAITTARTGQVAFFPWHAVLRIALVS